MKEKLYNELVSIINRIDDYSKDGFKIKYDISNNAFIVNYKNSKDYFIRITNDSNECSWKLEPYNNSHFTTAYDNGFDMVLFAIKENETIYK